MPLERYYPIKPIEKKKGFFQKVGSGLGLNQEQKKERLENQLELEGLKTKIAKERKAQGIKPGQGGFFQRASAASGISFKPNTGALFGAAPQQSTPKEVNKRIRRSRPKKVVYYG